jgi:hypothetical protein
MLPQVSNFTSKMINPIWKWTSNAVGVDFRIQ